MDLYNDKEQELLRKEQAIKAKETEIRLRELELEINQKDNAAIPHYQTRKHQSSPKSLKKLTKKLVNVAKFLGFTIFTVALMKVGFLLGMWLAHGLITIVIVFIGYQIFLADGDR